LLLRWGDDPLYLLYTRTVDPVITGYHAAAVKTDVVASMNDWAAMQPALRGNGLEHVSTQPPGLPLVYEASIALMERLPRLADTLAGYLRPMHCLNADLTLRTDAQIAGAWPGLLGPLWSALAVFPLHWLARQMLDRRASGRVTLLWPLIPGIAAFAPSPSTAYPALIAGMLALLYKALSSDRRAYAVLAGAVMFVASFLNLATLPALLVAGLFTLLWHRQVTPQPHARGALRTGVAFAVGLCLP